VPAPLRAAHPQDPRLRQSPRAAGSRRPSARASALAAARSAAQEIARPDARSRPARSPITSPIDLAHDRIQARDAGHDIGDDTALRDPRQGLQIGKRRRALVDADGPSRAVTDDVEPELTAWRLDTDVGFARGWSNAFGPQLEVMDNRLHAPGQLLTRRWHDF